MDSTEYRSTTMKHIFRQLLLSIVESQLVSAHMVHCLQQPCHWHDRWQQCSCVSNRCLCPPFEEFGQPCLYIPKKPRAAVALLALSGPLEKRWSNVLKEWIPKFEEEEEKQQLGYSDHIENNMVWNSPGGFSGKDNRALYSTWRAKRAVKDGDWRFGLNTSPLVACFFGLNQRYITEWRYLLDFSCDFISMSRSYLESSKNENLEAAMSHCKSRQDTYIQGDQIIKTHQASRTIILFSKNLVEQNYFCKIYSSFI